MIERGPRIELESFDHRFFGAGFSFGKSPTTSLRPAKFAGGSLARARLSFERIAEPPTARTLPFFVVASADHQTLLCEALVGLPPCSSA